MVIAGKQGSDPLLEIGGIEKRKEECRDARGTRLIEDTLADVKYAICCRFGTCRPAGSDSRDGLIGVGPFFQKLYLGDSWGPPRFYLCHREFPAVPNVRGPPHSFASHRIAGISRGENPFSHDRFQPDTCACHRGDIGLCVCVNQSRSIA